MAGTIQSPKLIALKPSWRAILMAAIALAILWFVRDTILLVFAGALLALVLRWASDRLHDATRLPAVVAVWLVVLVTVAMGIALAAFAGTAVAAQWEEFTQTVQRAFDTAVRELRAVPAIENVVGAVDPASLVKNTALLERAGGLLGGALGTALSVLVVLFVAVAGALEPSLYRSGFLEMFAPTVRPRIALLLDDLVRTLRTWLLARMFSMCVTGALVCIGLTILHVPMALLLGVLAGALALIPNFGAFAAGAPAVIIALSKDVRLAVAVVLMYWAVHVVDDFLVSPYIERRMVRLPPVLTLVAQLSLAVAAGGLGLTLAAPLLASFLVIVQRLWIDDLEQKGLSTE